MKINLTLVDDVDIDYISSSLHFKMQCQNENIETWFQT